MHVTNRGPQRAVETEIIDAARELRRLERARLELTRRLARKQVSIEEWRNDEPRYSREYDACAARLDSLLDALAPRPEKEEG